MKKALGILAALAVLVCGMTGAMAEPFRVGICQLVTHDALDAATQGFMDALTEELDSLQKENEKLKENQNSLEEKSKFLDAYVVFVEKDKSNVYHRYACSAFAKKSFWAYSRKLAESLGYKPCPNCFG